VVENLAFFIFNDLFVNIQKLNFHYPNNYEL